MAGRQIIAEHPVFKPINSDPEWRDVGEGRARTRLSRAARVALAAVPVQRVPAAGAGQRTAAAQAMRARKPRRAQSGAMAALCSARLPVRGLDVAPDAGSGGMAVRVPPVRQLHGVGAEVHLEQPPALHLRHPRRRLLGIWSLPHLLSHEVR